MTYQEIFTMLESTKLPVVYHSWPIGNVPQLPYIVFTFPSNDDFIADNINYQTVVRLNVELYSDNKDFQSEALVEGVLKAYSLAYAKSEIYLEDENMFETLYETEVIING